MFNKIELIDLAESYDVFSFTEELNDYIQCKISVLKVMEVKKPPGGDAEKEENGFITTGFDVMFDLLDFIINKSGGMSAH